MNSKRTTNELKIDFHGIFILFKNLIFTMGKLVFVNLKGNKNTANE